MKRASLALLLAASVAAGFLLWKPAPREPQPFAVPSSCDDGDSCDAGIVPREPEESVLPDEATAPPPPGEEPSRSDAPPSVVDAVKLREAADRMIASGQLREGLDLLRQATDANPTAKNHGDLGDLLLKLTSTSEALVHLRAAAELDPKNPDRWVDLANAYYRAVDPGEAWKAERKAREAQPGLKLQRGRNGLWLRPSDTAAAKP